MENEIIKGTDNPKKRLYNSLVTSKDPDVKEHFSQWSEDEFDKKLSTDKKFQKDLFLDLKDIGMATDEATFTKEYLTQPAPSSTPSATAPVAAPEAVAPVVQPGEPVPKSTSSRVAYESIPEDKTSTASKILSGIGKGVDMITAPVTAAYNFTMGMVKGAKATPVAKGYKDQGPVEVTEMTTRTEAPVIKFGKQYDPLAIKRAEATQAIESAKKSKEQYILIAKSDNNIPEDVQAKTIKDIDAEIDRNQIKLAH